MKSSRWASSGANLNASCAGAGILVGLDGGGGTTTDAPDPTRYLPHDIIRFFPKTKDRVFSVCAPLYELGCSLREIEEKTGYAKSTIRETLSRQGLVLRKRSRKPATGDYPSTRMRSPVLPYGYAWLEGKLVVDPREYKVVIKIMDLWHAGKSSAAIASHLNDRKIPTRFGKKWFHSSVGSIVKRQLKKDSK